MGAGASGMCLGTPGPVGRALAFAAVCVRLSVWISDFSGSPVAGICCFGVLGFAVIAATQHLRPSATAADHIPVITSTRDTPRSSYAGSPLRHSRENTPRAIPCPEASLTTTLSAPHGTRESATAEAMPSNVAALLQQLPHLQAELAKAHQAQGQQASELSSVRRELEELQRAGGP
eukprot:g13721.t1